MSNAPLARGRLAFTLLELMLAIGILALLTGAVYSISSAALDASRTTMDEQFHVRRLESFLRVVNDAFVNLPREGQIEYKVTRAAGGAPVPEIIFKEAAGIFGIPTLGGGSLVLAARPRADGSRTLSILQIPRTVQGRDADKLRDGDRWVPLLPQAGRIRWTFLSDGTWREEWPENAGRPRAVRLQMDVRDVPGGAVDAMFWVPPLAPIAPAAAPTPAPSPSPPGPRS